VAQKVLKKELFAGCTRKPEAQAQPGPELLLLSFAAATTWIFLQAIIFFTRTGFNLYMRHPNWQGVKFGYRGLSATGLKL
jgi:hypothetical protein